MDLDGFLRRISVYAIPVLFAVTMHEAARGWVAWRCGDRTPQVLRRLSLNPLKHVDPAGTVILPALLLSLKLPFFGWARPLPQAREIAHPRRASILAGFAGLSANFIMALLWCALLAASIATGSRIGPGANWVILMLDNWLKLMAEAGIVINVYMGFFNLLPIPPLDGGRIVAALLPSRLAAKMHEAEPVGILVVLGLAATGGSVWLFKPAYDSIHLLLNAGGAAVA